MYLGFPEEGDRCPEKGCTGHIDYPPPENCSCHINPPCSSCVNRVLTCPVCGWEDESPDHKDVIVAPGLSMREHKPRPLDPTKIDYRIQAHSPSSQKVVGVYPAGTSQDDVRKKVNGTFGGRFESFGNGRFVFIAYTD